MWTALASAELAGAARAGIQMLVHHQPHALIIFAGDDHDIRESSASRASLPARSSWKPGAWPAARPEKMRSCAGGPSPALWQSAVTGIIPATSCSRMRSTPTTRRLLISRESTLFIALSPTRNEITIATERRLNRVMAISNSSQRKTRFSFLVSRCERSMAPNEKRETRNAFHRPIPAARSSGVITDLRKPSSESVRRFSPFIHQISSSTRSR